MREYGVAELDSLLTAVRDSLSSPSPARERGPGGEGPGEGTLYLVASTSHLAEGWRERVPRFELGADPGSPLEAVVRESARALGFPLVWETPAAVIPLPSGWEARARPAARFAALHLPVRHFDPYSVVLRLVARGDEPDYQAALAYLRHGWVELVRLETLLGELLPRFTSATLAQDPAEFRRKFRGLRQLRASVA